MNYRDADKINEDFLLSNGGLLHKAMIKIGLGAQLRKLAVCAFCITWLPLFILSAIEGTLYTGTALSFLQDIGMQARLLIALPMLILIKGTIDKRVNTVLKYFTETLVNEEDRKVVVPRILDRSRRLTDSGIAEILIMALVVIATTSFLRAGVYASLENGATSWMTAVKNGTTVLSKAGYWAVIVSIPVFQFFLLRWLWRYFVWIIILYRFSRTRLDLLPTHADKSGGLGILMLAQKGFNKVFVIGSIVLSGQFIVRINNYPDYFIMVRNEVIVYVIIVIAFIVFPFVFFSENLQRVKNNGLKKLSELGYILSNKFEREWTQDSAIEKRVEDNKVDPSMLYDYGGLYDQMKKIRSFPVTVSDITTLAMPLILPFIPILFIRFSVGELLQKILGMLV
jgi:hypothetical protein